MSHPACKKNSPDALCAQLTMGCPPLSSFVPFNHDRARLQKSPSSLQAKVTQESKKVDDVSGCNSGSIHSKNCASAATQRPETNVRWKSVLIEETGKRWLASRKKRKAWKRTDLALHSQTNRFTKFSTPWCQRHDTVLNKMIC